MNETAYSDRGMVAAPHSAAMEAGREILAEGGNAVEAMIAMAAASAVVYPHRAAPGGDALWMVRTPDDCVHAIRACGPAGGKAVIATYRDAGFETMPVRGGPAAATVAGMVGGWIRAGELAQALGGRLPRDVLMSAAIAHARTGVPAARDIGCSQPPPGDDLHQVPGFLAAFGHEERAIREGEILRQPALAEMLEHLVHAGFEDFYRGDVGREIAMDLARAGSPVMREDLARYEAKSVTPVASEIMGGIFHNLPSPAQGLAALQVLGLVERLAYPAAESAAFVHGAVEAIKQALTLRDRAILDPAHMEERVEDIPAPAVLDEIAAGISFTRALPWRIGSWCARQGHETGGVWMGAVDARGVCVSHVQSLCSDWGSGLVLPQTGVLWNNRGTAFSLDAGDCDPLGPGRLPVHALDAPLAVMGDGRVIAYGAAGEGRIEAATAIALRHIIHGMDLYEAIARPRWRLDGASGAPGTVLELEPGFDDRVYRELYALGHEVDVAMHACSRNMGHAGMIVRQSGGRIAAAHDPRADGGAAGL